MKEVAFSIQELNPVTQQGRSFYNPNDCNFMAKKSILQDQRNAQHLSKGELRTQVMEKLLFQSRYRMISHIPQAYYLNPHVAVLALGWLK